MAFKTCRAKLKLARGLRHVLSASAISMRPIPRQSSENSPIGELLSRNCFRSIIDIAAREQFELIRRYFDTRTAFGVRDKALRDNYALD
jgi:hypothetical protein